MKFDLDIETKFKIALLQNAFINAHDKAEKILYGLYFKPTN